MTKEKVKVVEKYGAFSTIGFFPIKDQVLVLPLNVMPVKKTNLLLPDSISQRDVEGMQTFDKYPYQAIVVAVGPGFDKEHPMTLRPGMRVYMNQPFVDQNGKVPAGRMFLWDKMNYYKCQEGNISGIADSDIDDPRKDWIDGIDPYSIKEEKPKDISNTDIN